METLFDEPPKRLPEPFLSEPLRRCKNRRRIRMFKGNVLERLEFHNGSTRRGNSGDLLDMEWRASITFLMVRLFH